MHSLHRRKIDTCPVVPKKIYRPLKENGKDVEMPASIQSVINEVKVTYNNREQIILKMQLDSIKQAILSTRDESERMQLALEGIRLNRAYTGIIEFKSLIKVDIAPLSIRRCSKHKTPYQFYTFTRPNGEIYVYDICRKCDCEIRVQKYHAKKMRLTFGSEATVK